MTVQRRPRARVRLTSGGLPPLRCRYCKRTVNRQAALLDSGRVCRKCIKKARDAQAPEGGTP